MLSKRFACGLVRPVKSPVGLPLVTTLRKELCPSFQEPVCTRGACSPAGNEASSNDNLQQHMRQISGGASNNNHPLTQGTSNEPKLNRTTPRATYDISSSSTLATSGPHSIQPLKLRARTGTPNSSLDGVLALQSANRPRDTTMMNSTMSDSSKPSKSNTLDSSNSNNTGGGTGWQYLVALCAVSVVICYADRSNISTAVLPMAEQFNWDKTFQGVVLSTFFSGYALTQVLGGQLADKLGGKVVLAGGVTLWSFFTLLTPEAAAAGTFPLLAARVLLGVGEGVAFPSIHSLIARNVPQASQSTAVGIVTAASYAGTAVAFGISPLIISKLGWQWVFYLFAGMAVLWLPLWLPVRTSDTDSWKFTRKDKDSTHGDSTSSALPSTSVASAAQQRGLSTAVMPGDSETTPLLGSSPADNGDLIVKIDGGERTRETGFWALLKRKEVWAICAAQYCQSWGMYGLLNWLPTFFKDFYQIEIADLGAYTLAPYVVQGGLGLLSGVIADRLLASGWGVRPVRILLQVVGMLGPAACLMLAVSPAVGASPTLASQLITIGLGFSALTLGGVSASHLDVAPRHAGVIFGAGNTAATLAGLLSVPFTGYLLQATNSWPLVFGITAAHYVVGAALWTAWVGDKPLPEDNDPRVGALPSSSGH